jgi:IstB-like ATP binding protein
MEWDAALDELEGVDSLPITRIHKSKGLEYHTVVFEGFEDSAFWGYRKNLGGMAEVLETRLQQAQVEPMAPIDFLSCLVSDELTRRSERLLERRRKQAQFRDAQKTLDNFDFNFNQKMNRSLVFDLATATFVAHHEDALF